MLPNLPFKFLNHFKKSLFIMSLIVLISTNLQAANYYVNDTSTLGDVYTCAIGNDLNDGKSSKSPKLTLLTAYAIASTGDVIYVDNGNYEQNDATDLIIATNSKKIQIIRAGIDIPVFEKNILPPNQKVSPAIFYVDNDKPIEREVYLQQLQNTARKN